MEKPFVGSIEEVISKLSTDTDKGLTSTEAGERFNKFGPNSLGEEKSVPLWKKFLLQFADAMVIILIVAAALSAVMAIKENNGFEGWIDVFVIVVHP